MRVMLAVWNLVMALTLLGAGCEQGGDQANPPEARGTFAGLYQWFDKNEVPLQSQPAHTYRRFVWKELEHAEGEYDFHAIRLALGAARARHQKFGFRVMSCWSGEGCQVPDYLVKIMPNSFWFDANGNGRPDTYVPDWNSPQYLNRMTKLVAALGKEFDGDSALGWVDIGLYGNWGEWHTASFPYSSHPETSPASAASKHAVIDAHVAAFKRTRLLMMTDDPEGLFYALSQSPTIGMRRDSLGHKWFAEGLERSKAWPLSSQRWKTAPFVTEFYAPSPPGMLRLALEQVAKYHVCLVGNGNTTESYSGMSSSDQIRFANLNSATGARFEVKDAAVSKEQGNIRVQFKLLNTGNAPAYDNWKVRCVLTRRKDGALLTAVNTGIDLRKLLPGEAVERKTLVLQFPSYVPHADSVLELRAEDPEGYSANLPIGSKDGGTAQGAILGYVRA